MMKMKKFTGCVLIGLVMATSFTGCSLTNYKGFNNVFKYDKDANKEKYEYFADTAVKSNEVVLFNSFQDTLGVYNTDSMTWEPFYVPSDNSVLAYNTKGTTPTDSFYTIGSSNYNDFSILKYNEQEHILESIYDVDATDSIMPVGYYKNQMYFIHNKNDLTANETRSIAYFDGDKLVDLVDVKNALLTEAVIIEDKIYYVTYHQDDDYYDLFCYSFDNKKSEKITQIATGQIYRYGNELLYVDGDNNLVNLKNDGIYQLKPNSQVEILSDYGILLNYYADKNQDISCDIIRIKDNKILKTVSEYDGYIIEDSTLTIYCEGAIHHFDL
ncbi:MAG: hypothetical protein UH963_13510 [Agathobacter sp.]|nr:hypothetical protein [Agathobacter sp.]